MIKSALYWNCNIKNYYVALWNAKFQTVVSRSILVTLLCCGSLLIWLDSLHKDLFIKNRTRTVVTLVLFWFDFLWISLYHISLFQQQQFPTLQTTPVCLRRSISAIALRCVALVLFGAFQDQFSTERTVFQRQLECDCRPVGTLLYRKFLSKILSNCSRTSRKLVILRSYNKFWKDFQKVLSQKAWIWLDILCLRRIYSN